MEKPPTTIYRLLMPRMIYGVATLLILFLGYVGWIWYRMASGANRDDVRPADVIIVLGSLPRLDGQPSAMLRSRIQHGVRLYQEGWAPRLLLAGGAAYNRANQAQVMRDVAVEMGVPPQAMILEGRSTTTLQNVNYSKEIMEREGLKSAVVVTSELHMARALRMYRDAGVKVYGSPAHHSQGGLLSWGLWLREMGATMLYDLSLSP